MRPPQDGHEWFSIEDPDDNATWLFDTTFLLSDYRCIYGDGCQSITHEPDPTGTFGCCTHGAHFVDDEDRESVTGYVALLTPEEWQFADRAAKKGGPLKQNKDGDWVTRKVDGACIFLNRDGFAGGAGCALHQAAVNRGKRPLDWKPDVCWQVPIHLDIHENEYGHETIFVRAWRRRDWGPGGSEFHWWCIESESAYSAVAPLYLTSKDELLEMVGPDIYNRLVTELDRRRSETPVTIA
ncbi:MAG: hypothetical protein ACR2QK_24440 [Acidimicrobiales bacterium]